MNVLVIAPHADDETLGMGGTIARFVREGREVTVAVMTGHGEEPHPLWKPDNWERVRGEAARAMEVLGVKRLVFRELPAACLTETPVHRINKVVSELIAGVEPEELYLPFSHDLHRDHGIIAYAAIVHSRAYLHGGKRIRKISMYETPTETHLLPGQIAPSFAPNMWIDVSDSIEQKISAWDCYKSQHHGDRTPRSPEALRALAVYRGAEIGVGAAEAFMLLRMTR